MKQSFIGKTIALFIGFILLVTAASVILPEAQTGGDNLNESNLCAAETGCVYNASVDANSPCRDSTNQSNVCSAGQPTIPFSSLFGGQGIVFLIIVAGIFFGVYKAVNISKK